MRRRAGGDIGVASSLHGWRQSPFDPDGNALRNASRDDVRRLASSGRLDNPSALLRGDVRISAFQGRRGATNTCLTSTGAAGIASKDVTSRVATRVEVWSVSFVCSGGRRYEPDTGRWVSSNARHKGMRGRQRWDPQRCLPRVRIPRRSRKATAGAPNRYGARPGEDVLWSPCQRDGRRRLGW
jgi:hypothetical protein